MQMGFDFQDGSQGSVPLARSGVFAGPWSPYGRTPDEGLIPGRPDWASLRARFAAIHALRRSIDAVAGGLVPAGSFSVAAEPVLASARGQGEVVNRFCSGNGKAGATMIAPLSPTVPREATEEYP